MKNGCVIIRKKCSALNKVRREDQHLKQTLLLFVYQKNSCVSYTSLVCIKYDTCAKQKIILDAIHCANDVLSMEL